MARRGQLSKLASLHDMLGEGVCVDWDAVSTRLITHPHEASTYDRRYSPSPLELALRQDSPPPHGDAVRALVRAHRPALSHVDEFGRSPLHVACVDGASAEIAAVLLDEDMDLASKRTHPDGWIPLHFARGEDMAMLLIQAFPAGVAVEDAAGRIPLHFAACADDTPPGVVRLLLKEGAKVQASSGGNNRRDGGALHRSNKGKTPLDIICAKVARRAAAREGGVAASTVAASSVRTRELEKLEMLVKAASSSCQSSSLLSSSLSRSVLRRRNSTSCDSRCGNRFRLLHASIELGCPPEVVRFALSKCPEQISERDVLGRTPLFIAASTHGTSKETIDILLDTFPEACQMVDAQGRLPLHAAAERGAPYSEGGVWSILSRRPTALEMRDLETRMHPFMLAAIGEAGDVDTVYRLLREGPGVLSQLSCCPSGDSTSVVNLRSSSSSKRPTRRGSKRKRLSLQHYFVTHLSKLQ